MDFFQRFDRRLENAIGDAFARVFGGSITPVEMKQSLQREAELGLKPLADGRLIAPNHYTVSLSASDHDHLSRDEASTARTLSRHLAQYIADQGWDVFGDVTVEFLSQQRLHTGQFRAAGQLIDSPGQEGQSLDAGSDQHRYEVSAEAPGTPMAYAQSPRRPESAAAEAAAGAGATDAAAGSRWSPFGARNTGARGQFESTGASVNESYPSEQALGRPPRLYLEDGSGRVFDLRDGVNTIGRGQTSDFRIPDTGVSRQHAQVLWDGEIARLYDLDSTNGTTVNGGPVREWQLADGDVIEVGHSHIVFRFD